MAQGQVLQLVFRVYRAAEDNYYLKIANRIFNSFKDFGNRIDGIYPRVTFSDSESYYWFEEYPSEQPCQVLNGFILGIMGLYEYYMVTKSPEVKLYIDAALTTLRHNLDLYKNPGGISYLLFKTSSPVCLLSWSSHRFAKVSL